MDAVMYARVLASIAFVALLAGVALPQAADGLYTREGRVHVAPPSDLMAKVQAKLGVPGGPLGYTYEQMLGFPTFEHRLRTVENLFRDVLHPAEYGALMGNNMLAKANEPAQLCYMLWSQLDARAGREWAVPTSKGDWGVKWLSSGASPSQAISKVLSIGAGKTIPAPASLGVLDEPVKRLLARLMVAAEEAKPFLTAAFDQETLLRTLPLRPNLQSARRDAYNLLVSPYLGDVNDDTIIVADRSAYEAMRKWDANYAAFGSALFLRHFEAAMTEFRKDSGSVSTSKFPAIRFDSPIGEIVVASAGSDVIKGNAAIILDLGGNDRYTGLIGTPSWDDEPISVVIDLGGNDQYDGTAEDGNVGCGLFGLGMVFDAAGDDKYSVKNGGIGFGLYGTGIVYDQAGNDEYTSAKGWAQGAAYAGVGLLADLKGNDSYNTICMSMGFGGTRGVGTLLDVEGNDTYFTADTGNHSKAWGKTVSMCLGVGYGRRCDSGDGQNQGGGVGLVVEGAGDDTYHTSVFALGSGYWWGAGIFEERGGNDTYRCTHYTMGSGAHFAVGSFVDLLGDDKYNDRPDAVERWGAIGRDGSIAVCIDADGNDVWGNLTGGHADLNSYALFWDRRGDDVYKRMQPFDPKQDGNRPFGSATTYPLMLNFRDRMKSGGVFLDTGGKDTYSSGMVAGENIEWQQQSGPLSFSFGLDSNLAP